MGGFTLDTRIRAKPDSSTGTFEIATKTVEWKHGESRCYHL